MDAETEPDSNWSVDEELEENSKTDTKISQSEDKEEGEITCSEDENSQEPVTSSSAAQQDTETMADKERDTEATVTSTNEGEFSSSKTAGKSPVKAYKLGETVEKLRKTISFVMFKKKHDETSQKDDSSTDDKTTTGPENKKQNNCNGNATSSQVSTNGDHGTQGKESGEVSSDEGDNSQFGDGKEARSDNEDDDQEENAEAVEQISQTGTEIKEIPSRKRPFEEVKDDDDDSLRTPDPSSLSKSVMHLVDSVINENLAKEKSPTVPVKQPKARISPKAPIKTPEPTVQVTPVSTTEISTLTPKELDDQSTVLSYNVNLKVFRCDTRTCGIKTNKEEVIKAHIEQHTGSQNVWYKCIYCKTITKSIENIRKHLQKFHVTNVLRFSKLNSPSIHDVYLSLTGQAKGTNEAIEEAKKVVETVEQPVIIEGGGNKSEDSRSTPETIPTRRSSTGSSVKPAPIIRRNSSDSSKANYTTRLECYYKDQYYRCKMCGFKSLNADTFASHAYYHLHGSDGKKGLTNCGAANKAHNVADCAVVKRMMSLLQRQKDAENRSTSSVPKAVPVVSSSSQSSPQLQSRIVLPIQPNATSTPAGKTQRLILIPTSQSPNTNASQVKVSTATPSPIVIEPQDSATAFPAKKPPTNPNPSQTSNSSQPPIIIEPVVSKANDGPAIGLDQTPKSVPKLRYTSQVFAVSDNGNEVVVFNEEVSVSRPLVKCVYEDGQFVCLSCHFKCPSVRPITFRKHLWKDIHSKNECSHCAPNITFNRFRNCSVLNKLMDLLENAVQEAAESTKSPEKGNRTVGDDVVDLDAYSPEKNAKDTDNTETDRQQDPGRNKSDVDSSEATEINKERNEKKEASNKTQEKNKDNADNSSDEDGASNESTRVLGPIKPIELDSDFSGEDEYEDYTGEEGLRFGLFERTTPCLSRLLPYVRGKNKSLMEEVTADSPQSTEDDEGPEKLYSCVFLRCSQWSSNSSESFTIHNLTQHARTPVLPCSYCSGSFRDEHQLVDHINSSHKLGDNKLSRLYQCAVDQCYFATNYINEFKSHNTFEHGGNFELKCIYCNSKFPHGDYLVQHLQENIMKLIQCPLCPLASQMKSVILTHISQAHPDHPKRIITTSYTTCQKKLQMDEGDNESVEDAGKLKDHKNKRKSLAGSSQEQDVTDASSKEAEFQKEKTKPNILQRRIGAMGDLGGSINCNFICGTCSYSTSVQDDFHDHIIACVRGTGKSSPKTAPIQPSASKESESSQPVVIEPDDGESKMSKDRSRKSKPGSRTWEGTEVVFQEDGQMNTSQTDDTPQMNDAVERAVEAKQVGVSQLKDTVRPTKKTQIEIPKESSMPPKPGAERTCRHCTYTTVYEDMLPKHESCHGGLQNTKRNFICFLCNFSADKLKVYKYHMWLHRTSQPDRYYSCYYCKTHSNQQDVLEKHIEETHKTLAFKYEVVKETVAKLECLYCSKVAYSGTEEEMVKHVLGSHGMPRLHRFLGDVYELDVGEVPEILSPDHESRPVVGPPLNGKDLEQPEESPSRPIRAVRSRQNTLEEILNENQAGGETPNKKTSYTGMEGRFQCPYCNFLADEMYVWKKHMQKYVGFGSQDFPVFRCAKCKWTSTERQRVLDHAYGKHALGLELTEDDIAVAGTVEIQGTGQGAPQLTGSIERYHCDQCEFGSNQRHLLVKHIDEVHGKDKNDNADGLEEIAQAGDEIGFDDDPSDDYAPSGSRRSSGERHDNGSGGLKTKFFRCETCPYVTADKRLYYKHKKSHERQSKIQNGFQCGYCHFKALKAFIVKAHINKYHQTKPLKVLSISEGRPVKVFHDNDVFGEDIEEEEEPDQAFPIQPVKGKAPLEVRKDLAEKPHQAVPALPPALNKLVATPKEGANIPEDMIFKVPQKCPHCDFSTKVRYNLVRHLKSHQDNQDVELSGSDREASQTQGSSSVAADSNDVNQDEDADIHSDSSTEDEDGETDDEPAKKRMKLREDLSVFGYKIPNKDLYQCKKCVFMDKGSSKVRRHFCARHENYCPYTCGLCSFVSVSTARIEKHSSKAHPGKTIRIINREEQIKVLEGKENSEAKGSSDLSKIPQKPAPLKHPQQKAEGPVRLPESTDDFDEKLQSYIEPNSKDSSLFKCRLCGHDQDAIPPLKRHILSVHLVFYPYKCKYCFFAAVELNKTIKHVERSHPGQPLLVKKRKFTGEWPKLSDGSIPFDNAPGPPAPKLTKEPLQVQITSASSDAAPSPKMPTLSRAPVMQPPPQAQEKPKMLVSLLTQNKVPAIPIQTAQTNVADMVIKTEPVDAYWDTQPAAGNWSWHSPQGVVPPGSSRETTPLKTAGVDETSSQTTTSSGTEEPDKCEKKKLLYNCLYCGYQSKWAVKDVKIHLCAVHMRKYPYKCKHCPYTNRMKNNIFKHIKQEHPGMGLDYEDLIKEIDGMICVREDARTGMVYIGAYNEDGEIWEVEKANSYRKEIAGGWNVNEFQKLTEIQMNRTQSMGKPKASANKQRVELVVPRPLSRYAAVGRTLPQGAQTSIAPMSILATPPALKSFSDSPEKSQKGLGADKEFQDTNKEQVICHRCKVCDYRHGHLMKVYLHYLGVHLRKKPYVCGHCGFSQYTRHIVEKHHKIQHSNLNEHIRYLIPELKEQMKPYIVKVISKNRSSSLGGTQNSTSGIVTNAKPSLTLIHGKIDLPQNAIGQKFTVVFPGPVSKTEPSSFRPSPEKSIGTPASSGAGTPTNIKGNNAANKKIGSRGIGKLESAIQRLAQNALNNASSSSATPSPTFVENREVNDTEHWDDDQSADNLTPGFVNEEITEDLSTPGHHKCDLCPFIGKSFRVLKHHRRTHFSYRPYGCKYCALKSFYIANIRSHCELKHPGKASAYLQFEKPSVLQLDTSDRRLDKSLTGKSSSASQNSSADNEDDSILGLSSKMLPPLSKEDLALAEQGGLLDAPAEEGSLPSNEPVGPVICPLCPHFLPSSLELRKHLSSSHPGYGPYRCGYCSGIQRFKKGIKGHLSTRHPTMPPKYTLLDPSVPQGPQKSRGMENKQEGKNKGNADAEGSTDTPFMTEGAEEMSIDTSDMIEYVEDLSNGEKDDDDELKRNLADASSLYSCKLCNFVTKQGGAIRHHVMAHLSYCPFKCGHCGRQSVKSYPIKLHIKRQHPGKSMRVLSNRNEEVERTLNTHYVKHAVKNQSLTAVKSSVEVSSLGTWRGKRKQFENSTQKSPANSSSDKEKTYNDGLTSPNEDTVAEVSSDDQPAAMDTVKSPELLQYEKTLGNRKVYYQCVLCGFKCDNNTSIRRHLMWETTYKPYCCSLCKRTDILAAAMRKHLRDKHSSGRVIFKKNAAKEQRLVSLVNQSRHYTEKYKPPRIITPISPPRLPTPASEDSQEASDENIAPAEGAAATEQSDQKPLTPKKLSNGMVKCPSCPKIMKLKLFRKHMVFHGGHRVKCDICDKTFYYPSDVHKHHGTAHRNLDTPYQWSKLPTPVKPQNSRKIIHSPPPSNSSGLLKVKIAFKKDAQPEIVHTSPSQDVNGAARMPSGGNRHPNLITTDAMMYVQETDPDNPIPPHSKQASGTPMIDGLMLSAELFKKKSSGKLHCPHCPYVTTNREHLKIHYIRHVPPRWKCKYCETKGQLSYELRKHVKARHPEKPLSMLKLDLDYSLARENQGDGPLGPDFKPRTLVREDEEEDEEVDGEWEEEEDVEADEQEASSPGETEPAKPVNINSLHFNCFHCSFTAKSMMEFAQHVRTHEQSSPVKSPGSSKAPASPIHTDDDETEQFVTVTPVYGNRASTDNELTEEIKEEVTEPQYQCKLCPFTTNSRDKFEGHNRIHLPFRCGYCNYSQYQKGKIKQHHNYKHAPHGLELNIIEQNPKPPKKTQPHSKPGPKSTKKTQPYSKPGPKSTKKFIVEEPIEEVESVESQEEDMEDESRDDGVISKSEYDNPIYQPTIKLLDVQLLSDELLSVLLMKYGATRTPWMEAPLDADMNTSGESDSRGFMEENPSDEEEIELHMGDVSDNRELVFASDLEEEEDANGNEVEEEDEEREQDEEVAFYDEENTANLLDVGDEEIRVEDEGLVNEQDS